MFHATNRVGGAVLWANLHLLFWLSLFPLVTDWVGESHVAPVPTAAYGGVLLMAAFAYWILQTAIIRQQGPESLLARAVGQDRKGKLSQVLYAAGVVTAFWHPVVAEVMYAVVALVWLVPDRRIERVLQGKE
jgi:uncharacterized membrane protein